MTAKRDGFTWRPLLLALVFAGIDLAWRQLLSFSCDLKICFAFNLFRATTLNVLFLPWALIFLCFAAFLIFRLVLSLATLRLKRGLSLACAIALAGSIVFIGPKVKLFDLFYWYTLINQTRFEREAKARTLEYGPVFAAIEKDDISTGTVANPATFATLFYDESDELGLDQSHRSEDWKDLHEAELIKASGRSTEIKHLLGHFYLVVSDN